MSWRSSQYGNSGLVAPNESTMAFPVAEGAYTGACAPVAD